MAQIAVPRFTIDCGRKFGFGWDHERHERHEKQEWAESGMRLCSGRTRALGCRLFIGHSPDGSRLSANRVSWLMLNFRVIRVFRGFRSG